MKLSVTSAELKLLKEERVVVDSESVEHVEMSLHAMSVFYSMDRNLFSVRTYSLSKNKRIIDESQ